MKEVPKVFYGLDPGEEIIFRDYLAVERTRLANERTLLSYIRTSLYLLLGAIAFFQLEGLDKLKWLAYPSLVLSAVSLVIGILKYYRLKKSLGYTISRKQEHRVNESSRQPYK
ncbi:MAG: DUF202 domain-containing protein [Prolixibacteraceae bacterium]